MGFVTTGKPLTANHHFFRAPTHDANPSVRAQVARHSSGGDAEEGIEEEYNGEHDDDDDDEFVPAVEHVDDSEEEFEADGTDDEAGYVDAVEDVVRE